MNPNLLTRLGLLLIGLVFYGGALWDPAWSTVDDGQLLSNAQAARSRLAAGDWSVDTFNSPFSGHGRFRPSLIAFKVIECALFNYNPWLHHMAHVLVMLGVCQLLFSIAWRATASHGASTLTVLVFLFASPNVENWFRLTMDEFYVSSLTVASLWCLTWAFELPPAAKARRAAGLAAAAMLLVPSYLAKETSVALMGLAGAIWLACWRNAGGLLARRNLALSAGYLAAHGAIFVMWLLARQAAAVAAIHEGVYSSGYQVSASVMISTAVKYADVVWNGCQLLFPVALVFLLWRLSRWLRGRRELDARDGWAFVGLCWFGSILAVLLPWKSPLARYLGSGQPGLALLVGIMTWTLLEQAGSAVGATRNWRWRAIRWLVLGNLALLPVIALVRNYNYFVFRHDFDRAAFGVIETLAAQAPARVRLYMDLPAEEPFYFTEIPLLLRVLFGRDDFEQFNFNGPSRPEPRPGDYLLLFAREGSPRGTEITLHPSFHDRTLRHWGDRLGLVREIRYDRRLLNAYPDAPLVNTVARLGIKLPDYLGLKAGQRRALFACERSLVEWRIYRFER
ncbi:MAG: hypothetical protein HZA91_20875 [Verrucomicrobia bacterium]|nr:hypothetical protein [Verrucomicrobiota bacterium]